MASLKQTLAALHAASLQDFHEVVTGLRGESGGARRARGGCEVEAGHAVAAVCCGCGVGSPHRTNSSRPGSRTTGSGWLGAMLYRAGMGGTSVRPNASSSSSGSTTDSEARPHIVRGT
jgi:hypothetical protein